MKKYLILLAALLLISACGKKSSNSPEVTQQDHPQTTDRESETPAQEQVDPVVVDKYLKMVNDHRAKLGLRPLEISPIIEDVARGHSEDMATRRKLFGHHGWRGRCKELRYRLKANLCGENVAMGQKDHAAVFQAWLNSPPHRQLIEGASFTHTGLGFVKSRSGVTYWTQMFVEIE